jgi:NDP-sugar pyrophosphorylase family protein
MKVIVLAGGKGTRLPLSAKNIPKPLVKINNKTLIDYQIEFLEKQGFSDIRFSLGYMAKKIIDYLNAKYPKKYEWVVEKEKLGTGGALKFASYDLNEDFIAFNIDDFPKINLLDFVNFHNGHNIENTLIVYKVTDARHFGLVKHCKGVVQKFLEKPKEKKAGYINAGFYILNPKILKNFPQKTFSIERDVFPIMAKEKKLACYQKIENWFTTGTEERLRQAKEFLKNTPNK